MIPTGQMLREFDRLYKEARDVALSRDEFLQLVFNAAVKLADGSWKAPQITNCFVERIDENQRSGCKMGASGTFEKVDVL